MFFTFLVFGAALTLELFGSYISIMGLSKNASYILLGLAITLDFAKIIIATVLYKQWRNLHAFLKYTLIPPLIFLIIFTSSGAYAFLFQEFNKTTSGQEQTQTRIEGLEQEKTKLEARKKEIDGQIARLPPESVVQRRRMTELFAKEIEHINTRTIELDKEIPDLKVKNVDDTNQGGTIGTIAKAYGMSTETITKFLVFPLVLVIDPLAIILLTVANFLVEQRKRDKEEAIKKKLEMDALVAAAKTGTPVESVVTPDKKPVESFISSAFVEPTPEDNKILQANVAVNEILEEKNHKEIPIDNSSDDTPQPSTSIAQKSNDENKVIPDSVETSKVSYKEVAPQTTFKLHPMQWTIPTSLTSFPIHEEDSHKDSYAQQKFQLTESVAERNKRFRALQENKETTFKQEAPLKEASAAPQVSEPVMLNDEYIDIIEEPPVEEELIINSDNTYNPEPDDFEEESIEPSEDDAINIFHELDGLDDFVQEEEVKAALIEELAHVDEYKEVPEIVEVIPEVSEEIIPEPEIAPQENTEVNELPIEAPKRFKKRFAKLNNAPDPSFLPLESTPAPQVAIQAPTIKEAEWPDDIFANYKVSDSEIEKVLGSSDRGFDTSKVLKDDELDDILNDISK